LEDLRRKAQAFCLIANREGIPPVIVVAVSGWFARMLSTAFCSRTSAEDITQCRRFSGTKGHDEAIHAQRSLQKLRKFSASWFGPAPDEGPFIFRLIFVARRKHGQKVGSGLPFSAFCEDGDLTLLKK
jgi:hypothetical protein